MRAKKVTIGSARLGSAIADQQKGNSEKKPVAKKVMRTAAKAKANRKPAKAQETAANSRKVTATQRAAAKTPATPRRTATGRNSKGAAASSHSPDFSKVMETLERVRAKSDELDERISRLAASLA